MEPKMLTEKELAELHEWYGEGRFDDVNGYGWEYAGNLLAHILALTQRLEAAEGLVREMDALGNRQGDYCHFCGVDFAAGGTHGERSNCPSNRARALGIIKE